MATPVGVLEAREGFRLSRRFGVWSLHLLRLRAAAEASRLSLVPRTVNLRTGVIVDVGANEGAWTDAARIVVPSGTFLLVEPSPQHAQLLRVRYRDAKSVRIVEVALSDRAGSAPLHVTAHSHNSSLRVPRDMNSDYHHGWEEVDEIQVSTTTLDELLVDETPSLVKIDVQGAESAVLRGGEHVLRRSQAVLLEVTTRSHYEGDAQFPDLHRQMNSLGFELAGLSQPFLSPQGAALWFDACYVNSESSAADVPAERDPGRD
jgi:FkbM family methyltransferase